MDAVLSAFQEGWAPFDRMAIADWVRKNVYLHSAYAIQGPLHVERAKYLKRPLELLQDPDVREVTLYKAVQSGGSLIAEAWVCWLINNAPGPTMWNMQTDEDAKDAAEQRINPLFERCDAVRRKMPGRMDRKKSSVIFYNMWLLIQGAGLSNLQSKSVQYLINDETWMWKPGHLKEAYNRVTAFPETYKILNISQGGVVGDETDQAFENGSKELWGFRCPKCSMVQPYKLAQLKRNDNETTRPGGVWNFNEMRKTVRYECENPECANWFLDTPEQRAKLNDCGEYVITNPNADPKKKSLRIHGLGVDWIRWEDLMIQKIIADEACKRGTVLLLKELIQKRCAEPWSEEHAAYEVGPRPASTYTFEEIGNTWGDIRFLTADVQMHELWGVVRGWRRDTAESKLLWAGRIETFDEIEVLREKYGIPVPHRRPDGRMTWAQVFIDCKYERRTVYAKCAEFKWIAVEGMDVPSFPWVRDGKTTHRIYSQPIRQDVGLGTVDQGSRHCPLIKFSDMGAQEILDRLKDGKGAVWEAARDVPDFYWRQLNAEMRAEFVNKKTGKMEWGYKQIRKDNHLRDCEKIQVMAASRAGILQGHGGGDESEGE